MSRSAPARLHHRLDPPPQGSAVVLADVVEGGVTTRGGHVVFLPQGG